MNLCSAFFALLFTLISCRTLIYQDSDASIDLLKHLQFSLNLIKGQSSEVISAAQLENTAWESSCLLLIFPDGKEDTYGNELSNTLLDRIRKFVENGGSFMGIGAGAYLASRRIEFEVNSENGMLKDGKLLLFDGTAFGAAIQPYIMSWANQPKAGWISMEGSEAIVSMYAVGSCYFEPAEVKAADWETLGAYQTNAKPAIIRGTYGAGKVILSGPNIAVDHERMNGLEYTGMYKELKACGKVRREIFSKIISHLLAK